MRKSIATVSLSGSLSEKLTAIAAAGFEGVEIFENDLIASPLTPEDVRSRAADLGLAVELYQPFRDFEAVPQDLLERNLRRAESKFAVMERLGADLLLVCSSVSPHAVDDDALAAEQLHLLADRAHQHGIRIAYEALAWGRHVSTFDHAWRLVEEADHPALGTCLDSFHILSRSSDPAGIEEIPGEKIFFLQLADAPLMAMDVLQWSRHYRCFPGQGGLDVAGLLTHTVKAGYRGPLSLEVFNDVFRQADAGRTAVDAMRSLLALEESAGLSAPPAPVVPSGFAFAELTAADTEPLRGLLTALGFARTGRHTAKPVELWEQGEARVLLNSSGSDRRSGPTLAAVGLESPDPGAAVRRAETLLAPVVPRRRGPREAPLDAVAAPDGTELFFCRTGRTDHPSWTEDFAPAESEAPEGAGKGSTGISGIDHIALTQPWHHFDEAALFYRSVLGLNPEESQDLADPYGLFRSRAVANSDGSLRIALNVAPSPDGEATRSQHIALTTDDIVATARRVRECGAALMPVPANYYDDLDALHELPQETLGTFRELGILYDRDEDGEFLHFYTATLGRVFFEVVQRTGGYRGYGARNATVRLAAQHTAQHGTV
ncbi:bifunctional sugar phosphate isomerase/epimerase/4-hydroxyphenylpyruvate dioxygenase family protein [Streptomyces albidus (ex Kaewkla and Franco 2022)]|uniref:bifunctional sugar phosphate isomerase/epimerase/4-hydroxyphenylpyruvate dioxygenase family protein n=1 Tax=Streptomyces albidus (ex Kaewkla and Franco 2022) TaxID=722709 RepID=UPI0015EECD33|nr:sugar phosphate isomerase/epimerase and 4-hydroxyphenylpyruvate domain-containing protein [Streptomyces albidus (ex Kaewkla and Franco 2022)]